MEEVCYAEGNIVQTTLAVSVFVVFPYSWWSSDFLLMLLKSIFFFLFCCILEFLF